jgi:hypothetical protein
MTYTPGPGDILGQYAGHPHDPRSPEDDSDDTTEEALVDVSEYIADALNAYQYIADALNAYRMNDRAEYDRVLREAAKAINTMLGESK